MVTLTERYSKVTKAVADSPVTKLAADSPVIMGGCSYVGVVGVAQVAQFLLGVTTAWPLLPTALGISTVCVASAAAMRTPGLFDGLAGNHRRPLGSVYGPVNHDVAAALTGVVLHAGLGRGRFWALSPSSLASTGAFAWVAASLPANENYATTSQRENLLRLGRRYGCHTCGTRFASQYIGDHVPPLSLAARRSWLAKWVHGPVKFRFHPQCKGCCSSQASAMARAAGGATGRAAAGARVLHFQSLLRPTSYVGVLVVGMALAAEARWPLALNMVDTVGGATSFLTDETKLAYYSKPMRVAISAKIESLSAVISRELNPLKVQATGYAHRAMSKVSELWK